MSGAKVVINFLTSSIYLFVTNTTIARSLNECMTHVPRASVLESVLYVVMYSRLENFQAIIEGTLDVCFVYKGDTSAPLFDNNVFYC